MDANSSPDSGANNAANTSDRFFTEAPATGYCVSKTFDQLKYVVISMLSVIAS